MRPNYLALNAYEPAFRDRSAAFLTHYAFDDDGGIGVRRWTRGEFWDLARRYAAALRERGVDAGDSVLLCMGANQAEDLACRLASVMIGAVPVTVNWQADPLDRVLYKARITATKVLLVDDAFDRQLLASLRLSMPLLQVLDICQAPTCAPLPESAFTPARDPEATRVIIFTSGTTGQPKGVKLPYRAYATNRDTFEHFLGVTAEQGFALLAVNPMHHTNSTAVTDWVLRRPGSELHLVSRYSTRYWQILCDLAEQPYTHLVAPVVARHFDFLDNLEAEGRLPVPLERLQAGLARATLLIGSAPVGPTTVKRLEHYSGRGPTVRFGSTETCLQVIGVPHDLPEAARLAAFEAGWEHHWDGAAATGYYIGRDHRPHTEVRIVRAIEAAKPGFMVDCAEGQPGYIITRGANLMSGYVGDPQASRAAMADGWYLGLKDIGYALRNTVDGGTDLYWQSRESSLLIRGGANYAYDQINAELRDFLLQHFDVVADGMDVAVVGLNVDSEHEDSCCVTLELNGGTTEAVRRDIAARFLELARRHVSKGAKPDYLRIGLIPRNFKGAVLVPELRAEFAAYLAARETAPMPSSA